MISSEQLFTFTFGTILIYLSSVAYLIYKIKLFYPERYKEIFPHGIMGFELMTKGEIPVTFSKDYFIKNFEVFKGLVKLTPIIFTSDLSENKEVKNIKIVVRIFLFIALILLISTMVSISQNTTI